MAYTFEFNAYRISVYEIDWRVPESAIFSWACLHCVWTRRPIATDGVAWSSHQCRINHVADVANATGLRPQGGLRK